MQYQKPVTAALRKSTRFEVPTPITELMADAQRIVQLGNQAGEGWYLVALRVPTEPRHRAWYLPRDPPSVPAGQRGVYRL
ncbi:hypothetical protein G6F52_014051 [Rhizopus delemar]|nr:hypothetical protein G6F52_014051 [Rhizopus delemar]